MRMAGRFTYDAYRHESDEIWRIRIVDGNSAPNSAPNQRYRYSRIRLNEGSLDGFRAPEDVLTEEQKLLRLHRIAMDGHLFFLL